MDDVHDDGVADLPDAVFLHKDFEIVGVAGVHWVAAEVVDQAVDALIAPHDCGGGRGEMEVEDLHRDG